MPPWAYPSAKPNPEVLAPVDAYMTDEKHLIRILESDASGALGEDCVTDNLVSIEPAQLGPTCTKKCWRRIYPAKDAA